LSNILVNLEWLQKYNKLHYTKRRQLDHSLQYIGTNTTPDLPAPLLELYKELNNFNLANNDKLKKKREVPHEKK